MNYGRHVLLGNPAERARFPGGLATPDVAQRGGIFGAQGHGGGIFDGSLGQTEDESVRVGSYAPGDACAADMVVRYVQAELGVEIDGIWGPESQGALSASGQRYQDVVPGCTGPVPSYSAPRPPPPEPQPEPLPPVRGAAGRSGIFALGVFALALGGAAYYLSRRRRR